MIYENENCQGSCSSRNAKRGSQEDAFTREDEFWIGKIDCYQSKSQKKQTPEILETSRHTFAPTPASTHSSSTDSTAKTFAAMSGCEFEEHHSHDEPHNHKTTATRSCCSHDLELENKSFSPHIAGGPFVIQIDSAPNSTSESITLSVQGMTCTGCEKSLYKSLSSYTEISEIKVSLLLAQADFTLTCSYRLNRENVAGVIGKRTGFVCCRVANIGGHIDLIVPETFTISKESRPIGVSDILFVGKHRVRVSYHPKEIGARVLLSKPYFQGTKLAPPSSPHLIAAGKAHVRHELLMTLLSAALTIPVLVLSYASLPDRKVIYGGLCLTLATLVQILVAGPFYPRAFNTLFYSRMVEMDMLVVLSTTTAYVYSCVAYIFLAFGEPLSTPEFFETSTLLVTLIMVGRTLSAFARQKAVESILIESKQESKVVLVHPGNEQQEIDARLLQYGDVFKVYPESAVVTDGMVIEGRSEIDESLLTGESILITKGPGMSVIAGSMNHSGTLTVVLSSLPCDNTIQKIGAMVDEATSSKPKVQEMADRVAGMFVPVILVVACFVFVVWVLVGKLVKGESSTTACINAMTYAISVLIVSCPCAIGLAVPMVAIIAAGVGARHGLILKSAESLEVGRKITHVVFDKTGTLTNGHLSVIDEEFVGDDPHSTQAIILGLASTSQHPVSTAITSHIKDRYPDLKAANIHNIKSRLGGGIEVEFNNVKIRAGNPYWLGIDDNPRIAAALQTGLTIFCVTQNNQLTAIFGLQDQIRIDALDVINNLRQRGIEISLVSGDNEKAVNKIATYLGIPASHTRSRCNPKDKQAYISSLKQTLPCTLGNKFKLSLKPPNKNKPTILFIGDGTNDAIALALADIGLHLNRYSSSSTSTTNTTFNPSISNPSTSAASVILMRPTLSGIITLLDLSNAFHKRVVFNFAWSFLYNVFAILLAAGAMPRARIEPRYAGLGELCSVLPVVIVAAGLRLKRF